MSHTARKHAAGAAGRRRETSCSAVTLRNQLCRLRAGARRAPHQPTRRHVAQADGPNTDYWIMPARGFQQHCLVTPATFHYARNLTERRAYNCNTGTCPCNGLSPQACQHPVTTVCAPPCTRPARRARPRRFQGMSARMVTCRLASSHQAYMPGNTASTLALKRRTMPARAAGGGARLRYQQAAVAGRLLAQAAARVQCERAGLQHAAGRSPGRADE